MSAWERRTGTSVLGAALGLLIAACVLASCGEERDDRQAIRSAVKDLQEALAVGDMEGACDELTDDAQKHVGGAAHDPPTTCERDLVLIYRGLEKGEGLREAATRGIESIAIDGDRARAMVRTPDGMSIAVPLAQDDGDWKVDALYGGIPGGSQEDNFD